MINRYWPPGVETDDRKNWSIEQFRQANVYVSKYKLGQKVKFKLNGHLSIGFIRAVYFFEDTQPKYLIISSNLSFVEVNAYDILEEDVYESG